MERTHHVPLWKPILILVVIGLSALFIYPPHQRLKPGLDLAGGTTFIYEVDVPAGQDPRQVVDRTIEVLKKRVDPDGIRNLVWRAQAGNRIEIQMALPPKETAQKREAYIEAMNRLLAGNIDRRQVEQALRAEGQARQDQFARLAGGNAQRQQLLAALEEAHAALLAAQAPYDQAKEATAAAERALSDLPADAEQAQRDQARAQVDQARAALFERTRAFVDARNAYEAALQQVLNTDVDPALLKHALDLPVNPVRQGEPSPRGQAIDDLAARYPARADEIRAIAQAYAEYEAVKGPLDDPNDLIALMQGAGVLEFRIAPAPGLPSEQDYRRQLAEAGPRAGSDREYRWFVIDDPEQFAETQREREALAASPVEFFAARGLIGQQVADKYYILLANTAGASLRQLDRWELRNAYPTMDSMGFAAVGFELDAQGAALMSELTSAHKGMPMAIVLDGRVISTPTIQSRIADHGSITGGRGGFSQAEMSYLLNTLSAGSLEARVSDEPISIKTTGPQLGQDNLHRGLQATIVSFICVCAFIGIYYMFPGLVAGLTIAINVLMILGFMAMREATFTLPGIAGIVLTIGMAVDANVLIYERIREELERKADLRTAIRLGYDKALSAILDSNVTTMITCIVLYYLATTEVKGFALTLMIGIVATLFTALFVTRTIFEYYVQLRPQAKTLPMLPLVFPGVRQLLTPRIDWIGHKTLLFGIAGVLAVVSLVAMVQRGGDMLDVEFRSGTQVGFELPEGAAMTFKQVRERLDAVAAALDMPEMHSDNARPVSLGQAVGVDPESKQPTFGGFSIAVLNEDADQVSNAVKQAFSDVLATQHPIHFAGVGEGHEAPALSLAPVYPVRAASLGQVIDRPQYTQDVGEFLGGVAILLDDLEPGVSTDEVKARIDRMRLQPAYEDLGFRSTTVIGLEPAPGAADLYRSVVVLSRDAKTNYAEQPTTFEEPDGLAATEWQLVRDALQRDTSLASVSNFSSQVSRTMTEQAVAAGVLSLIAMVVYIWFRFGSLSYGLSAIIALTLDAIIAIGLTVGAAFLADTAVGRALLLEPFRVDLALIAAILTLLGYSINDKIVNFDRIRENRGKLATVTPGIVNDSLNQCFSRTILTGTTTLIALLVLYIYGGPGIRGFAFLMFIGVLIGTYTSIAIAAPLPLMWQTRAAARRDAAGKTKPAAAGA